MLDECRDSVRLPTGVREALWANDNRRYFAASHKGKWSPLVKDVGVVAPIASTMQKHDEWPPLAIAIRLGKVDHEIPGQRIRLELVVADRAGTWKLPPAGNTWPAKLSDEEHYGRDQQKLKHSTMNENSDSPKDVHFRDIAPAIEFVCWVVVALVPMLRLVNGPAVTDDQFVIQVSLFLIALTGGIGLRLYQILYR